MEELTDIKTTTYKYNDNYYIDIVETEKERSAWIYNTSYGIKSLMWAEDKKQNSIDIFLDLVTVNTPEYINSFLEEIKK